MSAQAQVDAPGPAGDAPAPTGDLALLATLAERLQRAISREPGRIGRLALAETTVELGSDACPQTAVRFVLGAAGVSFSLGPRRGGEVSVVLGGERLRSLCAGRLSLPVSMATGEVEHRGKIRSFLRVAPILRQMLAEEEELDPIDARQAPAPAAVDGAQGSVPSGELCAIECESVYKRFDGSAVLAGVDLGIPEGAVTVVMGPSGTGKSVLLKHLIGLLFPDAGEVRFHGRPINRMRRSELLTLRRRVGVLFQDGALFSSMRLYDNVAFPLRQHTDLTESEIGAVVAKRLADVGLGGAERLLPSELSGGMRKRAGLARAIVLEPEVVLFDEPDSGLDPVRTALLCSLIRKIHGEYGGSYVVITHNIETARQIGEYFAVLWQGRIIEAGSAPAIFDSPNPFVHQFIAAEVDGPLGMD